MFLKGNSIHFAGLYGIKKKNLSWSQLSVFSKQNYDIKLYLSYIFLFLWFALLFQKIYCFAEILLVVFVGYMGRKEREKHKVLNGIKLPHHSSAFKFF